MRCVAFLAAFGLMSAASPALRAADLAPFYERPRPIAGGWYLRGDIGITNQRVKKLDNALFATAPQFTWLDQGGFDSSGLYGLGIGYQWNHWLRFDVTGEYRSKANFHALDRFFNTGTARFNTNDYGGSKSEWVGLANVYVDLGTWWNFTPFVGVGVGVSHNRIHHFRDLNAVEGGLAYGAEAGKTNFAWAAHAGLAYRVTPAFTVELAYRYIDLGDAITGDLIASDGANNVYNPMHFKDITSHDVKLGLRWMFMQPPPMVPLVTKG